MPLNRILVTLMNMPGEGAVLRTVAWAVKNAGSPGGLRFALSHRYEKAVLDRLGELGLDADGVEFFGERGGLANAAAHMGDATHFLALGGEYNFSPRWDFELLSRFERIPARGALMTAMLGDDGGKTVPQAYLPALAEEFSEEGVRLQKGLPLVCSLAPVPTLVVNPAFLMGKRELLQQMDLRPETLSFAAYVAQVPVYALDRAPLWPVGASRPQYLMRPVKDVLPGTTIARFEQLAGFRYDQKRAGLRTNWGLFTLEDTYPQKMPAAKWNFSKLLKMGRPPEQPMMLTAFVDIPERRRPAIHYVLRFGFLKAIASLPLYAYTAGALERQLRTMYPNARSYPVNNLLPQEYLRKGMRKKEWFDRNKLLLMDRTARQHPEMSHVAWVDMDTLRHPICPEAVPDFSHLMDRHVHIATVDDVPDPSFIIAPTFALRRLADAVADRTQLDLELDHHLSLESLLLHLKTKFPDMIHFHPMKKRNLLFLTGFTPEVRDQRYNRLLEKEKQPAGFAGAGKDMKL